MNNKYISDESSFIDTYIRTLFSNFYECVLRELKVFERLNWTFAKLLKISINADLY